MPIILKLFKPIIGAPDDPFSVAHLCLIKSSSIFSIVPIDKLDSFPNGK